MLVALLWVDHEPNAWEAGGPPGAAHCEGEVVLDIRNFILFHQGKGHSDGKGQQSEKLDIYQADFAGVTDL